MKAVFNERLTVIRTDRDGVRTSSEYEVIKKGVTDLHPVPLSKK